MTADDDHAAPLKISEAQSFPGTMAPAHGCHPVFRMGTGPHTIGARLADLRFDEAAADGVPGQLDPVAHAELLQDVGPMPVDRLHTDHEQLGDVPG